MADRIAVMNLGVLEQAGSPQELYQSPSNRFVAGFIGSPAMNFATVDISDVDSEMRLKTSDDNLEVQIDGIRAASIRNLGLSEVVLGVRPEHLALGASQGAPLRVEAVVDVIEFLGNDAHIHISVGGRDMVATVSAREPLKVGDRVTLSAQPWQIYLFDPESGRSITDT